MRRKTVALFLAFCMLLTLLPFTAPGAQAASSAETMVSIAKEQVGISGSPNKFTYWLGSIPGYPSNGYEYYWCAAFVSWVANQAGEGEAVGRSANVRGLRTAILNAGGKQVSSPQAGDIVIYYCSTDNSYCHVGIMENSSTSIEGNYANAVHRGINPYTYDDLAGSTVANGRITVQFYRPNYKNGSAADISFTGMKCPATLTKGQSFALQGTIKSNSNITKVIAAIKQGDKQVKSCTIEKVNATTFKITGNSQIAKNLDFASLSEGSYSVKYAVYNSAGGFEEWEKSFKVTQDKTAVSFTGMKYPTTLTKGQSYALQGTIKSNSNITKVIAAIKQGDKQVKSCTIKNVNSATFKITGNKEITKALDFASLPAGSYSVKYAVYNSAGGFEEWEKSFKVAEDKTVIEFTGMKCPTTLTKGQSFALQGTIKSNSNITKVIAAIKQGGKQVKSCTIEKVNAATFKITGNSEIKKNLAFASLPAGSYSVKYAVYNSGGGFEEWEKSFKVTAPEHTHTLSRTAAKAATETATGNTAYWFCSGCKKYFSDSKGSAEIRKADTVIPKLAHRHTLTHVDRKNATENAVGNTEYWSCSGCGKYFSDANATQEIRQVDTVLPMLRHTHDLERVPAVASACTSTGSIEYWRCKGCGLCFADQGAGRSLGEADITVPPLGHSYENGVCTRDGAVDPDYRAPAEDKPDDIPTPEEPGDPSPEEPSDPSQEEPNDPSQEEPNDPSQEEPSYEELPTDEIPNEEPVEDGTTYAVHFQRQTIFAQGQFTDVPADQWYTRNVAEAYELGLLKGTSADTFSPYGHVTLAEAITMACRIHSIYQSGYEDFVQDGAAWYQVYLDYAYENNIISWAYYNADVGQTATRAQFAEIFANALPEEALGTINSVPDGSIPDVPMSSSYARYAYQLYRAGILTGGDANGTFSPNTYITRAEAAAIVSRMAESDNRVAFTLGE